MNLAAFSPHGKWLYTCSPGYFSCQPVIQEASTGSILQLPDMSGEGNLEHAAFAPDGARVAALINQYDDGFRSPPDQLTQWDMATGAPLNRLDFPGKTLTSLAYSSDGRLIAVGAADGQIALVDAERFQVVAVLQGHTGKVLFLAFSPGGRWLASAGEDGLIRAWGLP